MRVLIADENPQTRADLHAALTRLADVQQAEDGYELIAIVEQALAAGEPFDLIFLDAAMPDMGGVEIISALRAVEEEHGIMGDEGTRVIALADAANTAVVESAFPLDYTGFFFKPIDTVALVRTVTELRDAITDPKELPH